MKDGLSSPFVKFFYNGIELQDRLESFKYKESEEDDECCEANFRYDDRNIPDKPQFQEGAIWTVVHGYIGGVVSPVRTLYLQEIKWEYDDQNILLTASFTERAVSLKQRSHSKVYTKTSIVDILHTVAKVHGLTAYVEVPGQYTKPTRKPYVGSSLANTQDVDTLSLASKVKKEPVQIQLTDSLVAALNDYADKKVTQDQLDTNLFGSTQKDLTQAFDSGQDIPLSELISNRDDTRNLLTSFNTYGTIPQANRTDKQVLDELVKRQPDGPFFIDSHDDKVILKRRHFDKPSRLTFNWADGKGDLIAFQPESKNRSKKGTSVALTVQGYDKINKTFYSAQTSATSEGSKDSLAQAQLKMNDLNDELANAANNGLDNQITNKQFNLAHDNTNVVKVLPAKIDIFDKQKVLADRINELTPPDTNNKTVNDPTAHNPKQGLQNGGNIRRDAELKNNPGYIEVIGDPTIHKGQIITILGVSKKYSGNYYIKSVTHEIDGYKSYITRCDLVRQGINIKTGKRYADAKESGKTVNTTVGTDDSYHQMKLASYNPGVSESSLSHDKTRVVKVLPDFKNAKK